MTIVMPSATRPYQYVLDVIQLVGNPLPGDTGRTRLSDNAIRQQVINRPSQAVQTIQGSSGFLPPTGTELRHNCTISFTNPSLTTI